MALSVAAFDVTDVGAPAVTVGVKRTDCEPELMVEEARSAMGVPGWPMIVLVIVALAVAPAPSPRT